MALMCASMMSTGMYSLHLRAVRKLPFIMDKRQQLLRFLISIQTGARDEPTN